MVRKSFFLLAAGMLLLLTACTSREPLPQEDEQPASRTVALTVWGAQEDEELLRELFASFQKQVCGAGGF